MGFGNRTNDRPMPPNVNIGPPPSQIDSDYLKEVREKIM